MLEMIVESRMIYVVTGGVTALGVVSKIVSNLSLRRMVRAAGNMSKSTHALMRLIRAKFEHACMVSEKVENVGAFVDKYLYEYRTLGFKLHTWRRIQLMCVAFCLALGFLGAISEYFVNGMSDAVIKIGAYGGIFGVLLYLFHLTTDEKYCLEAARNYIVDYLENVCLHKYEKLQKKEEAVRPEPVTEPPSPAKPEINEKPEITPQIRAFVPEEKEVAKPEEKKPDKDILIRQILEEFMA